MNKRGAVLGGGILTIYRLVLVSVVAFVILGLSAVFYPHYIDVRDVEAKIMARNLVECLASDGVIKLDSYNGDAAKQILTSCGIGGEDRFYVNVELKNGDNVVRVFKQGDGGTLWIREFLNKNKDKVGAEAIKVRPGHFLEYYPVTIYPKSEAKLKIEVMVKGED